MIGSPFRGLAALALVLLGSFPASAQRPPPQLDSAAILHRIRKLEVLGSVLYVAAHPDDENTRLLAYLSNGRLVRTAYLSMTRGDGGQNLIGTELGEPLGILRTQELLEARRIDGAEQFFTRAVDFGYSKSPDETFAKWGRQAVLGDVVRVIRTFRPDAIVTRFATDGSGGHGHHTASAVLAHEAFDLAADPKAFPEQLAEGLEPWRTKRLFFNGSTWWKQDLADVAAKDPAHWVSVDVGGYDPLLGASYGEIAGRSRSQHKSQGFGAAETRGPQVEYFRLEKGAPLSSPDLLDGVETGWKRIAGGEKALELLRGVEGAFDPLAPEKSVPGLSALARALDELDGPWARHHATSARELVLQAAGVVVEATANVPTIAEGDSAKVTLSALQRRPGPRIELVRFEEAVGEVLRPNAPWSREIEFTPPAARAAAKFGCTLRLEDGLEIHVERGLHRKWVDRVAGERMRPVAVTPPASIHVVDPVAIVRGDRATVAVEVEALRDDLSGDLTVSAPAGWTAIVPPGPIGPLRRGGRRMLDLAFRRENGARAGLARLSFGSSDLSMHVVDHPHVLPQTWYSPAEVRLVPLDVAVNVATVGYLPGAGDEIPEALRRLGVAVRRLDPETLQKADLEPCDAIVTGIRAYNVSPALARLQPMLLDWVASGGTLLVQYVTSGGDLQIDPKRIGPHPFVISRERVTVEEAEPTFVAPDNPLLTTPNRLGPDDFAGWVQERGLYFAGEVDARYAAPIAWSDPGEKLSSGALITCDHGKGRFTYTGLSLFRQLPAGVPGGYRILANLLARRTPRE